MRHGEADKIGREVSASVVIKNDSVRALLCSTRRPTVRTFCAKGTQEAMRKVLLA